MLYIPSIEYEVYIQYRFFFFKFGFVKIKKNSPFTDLLWGLESHGTMCWLHPLSSGLSKTKKIQRAGLGRTLSLRMMFYFIGLVLTDKKWPLTL